MATVYWLGSVVPVPEQQTLTVGGTWVQGDTPTITINGKSLILTVGSTVTTAQVAADLTDMINGAAANSDESRSALGTSVGEWDIVTATVSGSVVTVTGASDGRPIGTITAVDNSTAGTLIQAASVTAAGPGWANDTANWSGGALPQAADVIVFDERASGSCLYDLDAITGITAASVHILPGFRYQIGLPEVNRINPNLPFDEPNDTYLELLGVTNELHVDAPNSSLIKIDLQGTAGKVLVKSTGSTTEVGTPACLIKANNASSELTVRNGSVGLNYGPAITGNVATVSVSGGSLHVGDTTTFATLKQTGGTVVCQSSITTVSISAGTFEHRDGTVTTLNAGGGQVDVLTDGTYTTVYHTGGVIDCVKDPRGRTFTNYSIYPGCTLNDPLNTITFTNGIDVHGKLSDVTLNLAPRKTYSITAI